MPINLLGEPKHPIKKVITKPEAEMHLPAKELKKLDAKKKKAAKLKAVKKPAGPAKAALAEVNLIKAFKIYILKKSLTFIGIFAIIILLAFSLIGYFLFFYKPQPKIAANVNQPAPVNIPVVNLPPAPPTPPTAYCGDGICNSGEICSSCPADCGSCPLPPPPTAYCGDGICNSGELCSSCPADCGSCSPAPPLPDTELAPLRGSLVRFLGSSIIYLVEKSGELRQVDINAVSFLNGQKISQVSPNLIYTIADQFKSTRKGKDVIGKVNWDPRILSQSELEPFLK